VLKIAKKVLRLSLVALSRLVATGWSAEDRFALMVQLGGVLRPDYRFKWPQMEWWGDDNFNAFLERFDERRGLNTDRRLMLGELVRLVEDVPGDTVECGVYRGAGSYLICSVGTRSRQRRTHHVFDSFEGLSAPTSADGTYWSSGDLSIGLDVVQRNLAEFQNVRYYQGWIPARFGDVAGTRFAFVHVDVDLMEPTRDSVAFFYSRLNDGGILLCDDYGFTTCPGATTSIDEFLADKPEKMIRLSDGGGFFIKGRTTAAPALAARVRQRSR
jgi:O-methyltransferase